MMKMADIELVIKIPEKVYNALTHTEFDANLVVGEMRKSIANGTPLVQCKDCKYGDTHEMGVKLDNEIRCNLHDDGYEMHEPNWFCADGEEQNDETN